MTERTSGAASMTRSASRTASARSVVMWREASAAAVLLGVAPATASSTYAAGSPASRRRETSSAVALMS
ncbi:hypothetical protein WDV94_11420 [Clavibacter tessellarius]